jgi:hypothetical protein
MVMGSDRWRAAVTTATAAVVGALLLAGCGGAGSDAPAGAAALTRKQVRGTLPDRAAMPGWEVSARPTTVEMSGVYRAQACPPKGNAGCEDSRFFGASTFQHTGSAAHVTLLVVGYDSVQAAREAYDVLGEGHLAA